jgi:3-hydroxyisobutyrate dehydrogenase
MKTAVIGLGQMGLGMATTLRAKGVDVVGFDVSEAARAKAGAADIPIAAGLVAALESCQIIILSLPLATHVTDTVERADGILAVAPAGAVVIDTSTSEAAVSRRLAIACDARAIGFLDAPVSGGPAAARTGALTMMIGGEGRHLTAARSVIDAIAAKVVHVGPSGAGNVAKLVNNLLVAVNLLTVSEGMKLAEAAGVPTVDVLKVVNAASGRSAVSEVNYPRWIESGGFDSGFTMGLMRKDVRLAAQLMRDCDLHLPMAQLASLTWADSADNFPDDEDFNRIVTREM